MQVAGAASTAEEKGAKGKAAKGGEKEKTPKGRPEEITIYKSASGRSAALDGYFLSADVALVAELQVCHAACTRPRSMHRECREVTQHHTHPPPDHAPPAQEKIGKVR